MNWKQSCADLVFREIDFLDNLGQAAMTVHFHLASSHLAPQVRLKEELMGGGVRVGGD